MQRDKRRPKTGTKLWCWFGNTTFSTGHFSRVAAQKVIHGLGFGQFADGGQDTKGIGREKKNVFGMTGNTRQVCIANMVDGIYSPRIFSVRVIIQIQATVIAAIDNIL